MTENLSGRHVWWRSGTAPHLIGVVRAVHYEASTCGWILLVETAQGSLESYSSGMVQLRGTLPPREPPPPTSLPSDGR